MSQLLENIEQVSEEWAREFLQERIAFLRKRKIEASGELIRSFDYQLTRQAMAETVTILFAFREHGRIIDIRRPNLARGGDEYVQELVEWIKDRGLQRKMIGRYVRKYGYKQPPNDVLNRIAWGIVRKRSKKPRRRQWWNKPKSRAISELYNRLAESMLNEIPDQFKETLSKP